MTGTAEAVPHDYLNANSMQALSADSSAGLTESGLTAVEGVPLEVRFTAYSTMIHAESAHMLLFDGDPAEGSPAIADQIIRPGAQGSEGTSIGFTTGVHHLYAALVEGSGSDYPATELDVNVIPPQPGNQ